MARTADVAHIKCGFCGDKFELERAQVNALEPGKPICHSFQYVDQKIMIEAAVYPCGQDICQRCASRSLFFAGQSWFDYLHRSGEIFRGEAAKSKRPLLYWLGWVLIVALLLFIMLLLGCHVQTERDKAKTTVVPYQIDYRVGICQESKMGMNQSVLFQMPAKTSTRLDKAQNRQTPSIIAN